MHATQASPTIAHEPEDFRRRPSGSPRVRKSEPMLKVSPPEGEPQDLPQKIYFSMAHARARMHPRLRHQKVLQTHQSVSQDLELIGSLGSRITAGEDVSGECLKFLTTLTTDAQRKSLVPEFLDICTGTLQRKLGPSKTELKLLDQMATLSERSTAIRLAKSKERAKLASLEEITALFQGLTTG